MHVWRTGSWSVVNVCFNSLLYHCRNGRRLKKCSKANEVLSLQRILPSKPKRKMKLLDQAQLSRITGLCSSEPDTDTLNVHVKLQQCFSGELAQGFSVSYQFIHIDKILGYYTLIVGTVVEGLQTHANAVTLSECQMFSVSLRFTPGAALLTEKKSGPTAADVEAIKVWKNWIYICMHTHINTYMNELCIYIALCVYCCTSKALYNHVGGSLLNHHHTYMHTYIHTYMHTHIHTCIHTCMHTHIHTHTHTYTHIHTHTYMHTHTHTHTHTHAYMHAYTHAYTHTRIHTHTHTHTHAYTHTHTHIHAYTHTHTHTHAYMHAYTHAYTHTRIHTHTHTHTHAHTYMHTHTHAYTRMHACIHTHACMHTYIHTYTHTHACMHAYIHTRIHAYTHTHTHTHTCIHTHIHAYIHTHTHTIRGVNGRVRHDTIFIDSQTQRYDICRYLKKLYDMVSMLFSIQEYIDWYDIMYLF